MRILIAEDDQVLADGLLRTLRASGAAVDHVASGSEADAALMTNNEFDLLILDLGLPKMHGLEVLKRVRNDPRTRLTPVVILTASREEIDVIKGYTLQANSYIAKPVEFGRFVEAVCAMGVYWLQLNEAPPQRVGVAASA